MEKSAAFYAGLGAAFEKMAIPMGPVGTSAVKKRLPDISGFLARIGRGKKGGAPTIYRPRAPTKPAAGLPFQQGLQATPGQTTHMRG